MIGKVRLAKQIARISLQKPGILVYYMSI